MSYTLTCDHCGHRVVPEGAHFQVTTVSSAHKMREPVTQHLHVGCIGPWVQGVPPRTARKHSYS